MRTTVFCFSIAIAAHICVPIPTKAVARVLPHTAVANKVIHCYKSGSSTVAEMYACAGVWVTTRILTLCFLEADCPVIPDSPNGLYLIKAALGADGKFETKISIDMKYVLSVPDRKAIDGCKAAACVEQKMAPAFLTPLMTCAAIKNDKDRALCLAKNTKDLPPLVECIATKGNHRAAISECVPNAAWAKVQEAEKCIGTKQGTARLDCLLSGADATQKALASCLSGSSDRAAVAIDCLKKSNPQMADKIAVAECAAKAVNTTSAAKCFTKVIGGDGAKIAACAAGGKDKMFSCLLGDKPEYKAASHVVACVQGGRDAGSLVANCSEFLIKDAKTRATLACAAQAGADSRKLASCAASSILPPQIAVYAACATTSQGPTSFALCAAGPVMNEEWRIAAECAVQTGGNPAGFAGCTAGRLTLKELTQCFTGKGCFGPNNTIVKTFTNAFNDVLHGPGANSEIVKALHTLEDATGGPHSVINDPGQIFGGNNSVLHKPAQIFGGPDFAINKGADDVVNFCAHNPCPKIDLPKLPDIPVLRSPIPSIPLPPLPSLPHF